MNLYISQSSCQCKDRIPLASVVQRLLLSGKERGILFTAGPCIRPFRSTSFRYNIDEGKKTTTKKLIPHLGHCLYGLLPASAGVLSGFLPHLKDVHVG